MRNLWTRRTHTIAAGLALASLLVAWRSIAEQLTLQPESRLWVEGSSTMRSWTCKASDVDAVVDAAPNGIAAVVAGEKGVRAVRVRVQTEKLDCNNGTMNDHMRKALKADVNPTIAFTLSDYDIARAGDGVSGTLAGTLTLGGVQKAIAIPALGKNDGGALHVTGSYPLNMKEYGLKPPTLMFGRIKVGETVTVKFDLLLKS